MQRSSNPVATGFSARIPNRFSRRRSQPSVAPCEMDYKMRLDIRGNPS